MNNQRCIDVLKIGIGNVDDNCSITDSYDEAEFINLVNNGIDWIVLYYNTDLILKATDAGLCVLVVISSEEEMHQLLQFTRDAEIDARTWTIVSDNFTSYDVSKSLSTVISDNI